MFSTQFSVDANTVPANFQVKCIGLQFNQKKKKLILSLNQAFIRTLTREKHLLLRNHILFMSSLFGSMHICNVHTNVMYVHPFQG